MFFVENKRRRLIFVDSNGGATDAANDVTLANSDGVVGETGTARGTLLCRATTRAFGHLRGLGVLVY